MGELRFEWDDRKEAANRRKHGVSFDEASSVFSDDEALLLTDSAHSTGEDRFVLLGLSSRPKLLVVCHAYRRNDSVIRIISARPANQAERRQYQERWNT